MFNKKHGKAITGPAVHDGHSITINNLTDINKRFMGGGMSQSYAAIYVLEHYQQLHKFEYVLEIGSQKGALSTYLANAASITEQFIFETYDITTKDWYSRENEGCGHWFKKLETISKYIKFYNEDCFSDKAIEHITSMINKYKTLIICDGGDKPKELKTFYPLIKPGDRLLTHDWPQEINNNSISGFSCTLDSEWDLYFQSMGTLFKAFRK